ncbi:hypothetical protein [Aestuariicoccus sp. MJ-SS9]|uniref:hypothetical protein n=1 Tax=Aestuariicoccus sp. MJ-SS9 TaxID=3079855 RepID=UPI002908EEAC|nr:hypothetical protein [Aestuariicoccus sp. MJ-SS9]MDU8910803.1 hypothetical protein [Aestuariicoccus sp. MJ-SS9]
MSLDPKWAQDEFSDMLKRVESTQPTQSGSDGNGANEGSGEDEENGEESEDGSSGEEAETATARVDSFDIFRVTVANVVLVLGYAIIVGTTLLIQRSTINTELYRRWSDSIYFFGFIMTLTALIVALASTAAPGSGALIGVVIQNAVALSSTVMALIARTIIILIGPVDEEEEPFTLELLQSQVNRLAEKVGEVAEKTAVLAGAVAASEAQIGQTTTTFRKSADEVSNTLSEKAREIEALAIDEDALSETIARIAKLAVSRIDDEIGTVANALKDSAAEIKGGAGSLRSGFETLGTTANSAATKTGEAFDGLKTSIDAVDADEILRDGLKGTLAKVGNALDEETARLTESVNRLIEGLEASGSAQSALREDAEALVAEISERGEKLQSLNDAIEQIMDRVDNSFLDPAWHDAQGRRQKALKAEMEKLTAAIDAATQTRAIWMKRTGSFRDWVGSLFGRSHRSDDDDKGASG